MSSMQFPSEIDAVLVLVHPTKEKARHDFLLPHLLSRGIPQEKIIVCAPTWGDELSSSQIFSVYDPFLRPGMPVFTFKARCLSKGEISLVLNFIAAARIAVERNMHKVIVLESDTWLREDFCLRLEDLLADLRNKTWDYVSLGEGVRTRPRGCNPSFYSATKAYPPNHQFVYRCTDSMLFQVSYLAKVLTTILPFRECLDWELNIQALAHKSTSWWADPPLAEQGTAVGRQETTLVA
jgi:hypothetical protein